MKVLIQEISLWIALIGGVVVFPLLWLSGTLGAWCS